MRAQFHVVGVRRNWTSQCVVNACVRACVRACLGAGFGLMYLPAVGVVGYYFDRRRALATGVCVCGAGIGTFVFAPLGSWLVENYGWKGANVIIGAIILNGIVFGLTYRPLLVCDLRSYDTIRDVVSVCAHKLTRVG